MSLSKSSKIAVLLGGLSKEREVSLRTGKAMAQALRTLGYAQVSEIDVGHDIASVLVSKQIEIAMIALHGRFGEDGTIQGLLEFLRIPYSGSGVVGSAIAMDKVTSKKLFQRDSVLTPPYYVADAHTPAATLLKEVKKLGFPTIAKPVNEGSTIGLSIVRSESEVAAAQKLGLEHDVRVLWEKYVEGTEVTVGFLKGEPLPVVEIVPKKGLFDYEAKYTKGMTEYFCPARISEKDTKKAQVEAKKAFESVQADSFARVDLILSKKGEPWVLEVNTIPGMTETSLLPKAAKAAGMTFEEMVEKILKDARLKI